LHADKHDWQFGITFASAEGVAFPAEKKCSTQHNNLLNIFHKGWIFLDGLRNIVA
jgi:hypothetical protein